MATPAVFVFVMEGCGACHDYLPKFEHVAAPYRGRLPIGIYDIAHGGRPAEFAEKLGVRATPTTVVMTSRGTFQRHVGSLGLREIQQLLASAT